MEDVGPELPVSQAIMRSLDILFATAALACLLPVFLLVSILLKFTGEGEIIYRQTRIGKNGREFRLLKFVTMVRNSESMGSGEITLPEDPRVLPVGRCLRKYKINELPQLWNVIRGDISLIGPRPQTRHYYLCFPEHHREWISRVRPGLSGVGSIIFRDEESLLTRVKNPIEFDEEIITPYKAELERWYVAHQSVTLYFELIITTIAVVILPGAGAQNHLLKRVPPLPPVLAQHFEP